MPLWSVEELGESLLEQLALEPEFRLPPTLALVLLHLLPPILWLGLGLLPALVYEQPPASIERQVALEVALAPAVEPLPLAKGLFLDHQSLA